MHILPVRPITTLHTVKWRHRLRSLPITLLQAAAKDPLEAAHLRILESTLGVNKKADNNFCNGDTGGATWKISIIPQCISYFIRVSQEAVGSINIYDFFLVYGSTGNKPNMEWHML